MVPEKLALFSSANKSAVRPCAPGVAVGRFRALDGLRGMAILLVFSLHAHSNFGPFAAEDSLSGSVSRFLGALGHINMGTELFLVLAGFFTYRSMMRNNISSGRFFVRRLFRIYPCFLVLFAVYIPLSYLFPQESKIPDGALPALTYLFQNLLLLPGIFPIESMIVVTWFLSYLVFFTAVLGIAISCLRMRQWPSRQRRLFLGGVLICFLGYSLLFGSFRIQLTGLLMGALLFEFMTSFPDYENWGIISKTLVGITLVVCPVSQYLIQNGYAPSFALKIGPIREILRIGIISFWASLLCYVVMRGETWINRFLSFGPLVKLGETSYSFYLIHGLCLNGIAHFSSMALAHNVSAPLAFWVGIPGAFVLSCLCTVVLYDFVEKPCSEKPLFAASSWHPGAQGISVRLHFQYLLGSPFSFGHFTKSASLRRRL